MYWWHVQGHEGHVGPKKSLDVSMFIFGENIIEVIKKYKKIPRIKKNNTTKYPDITPLTDEQAINLEKEIIAHQRIRRISLERAKDKYYLTDSSYRRIREISQE